MTQPLEVEVEYDTDGLLHLRRPQRALYPICRWLIPARLLVVRPGDPAPTCLVCVMLVFGYHKE